jgi:hypothetical protein
MQTTIYQSWVKFHPILPTGLRRPYLDLPLAQMSAMESLVMLAITKSRCIREFSIFIRWVEFHPPPLPLLQPRQPRLDLPLDLEECHGKFGDASYYRAQMHKEQTDRQTFFFIYIDI